MSIFNATLRSIFAVVVFVTIIAAGDFAQAQSYPSKPIRMIVPFAAGGISDLIARQFAGQVLKDTGQTVVIENRPGAGGNIGLDIVAKASPDGYTVALIAAGNLVINPFIYKTMPFNAFQDLVAVAPIAEAPQILVVKSSLPVKNLKEFIALAKGRPGELHYGSGGVGTTNHLAGDLFCRIAGVEMVHVPYRGVAPVVTDLLAGRIEMLAVGAAPVIEHVKAGTLRALAAASKERAPGISDLPTSAEAGLPGFEMTTWFGVVAPAKTPPEIVQKLNQLASNMSSDPAARKLLEDAYLRPMHLSPGRFKDLVEQDARQWSAVVKNAGISVE